MNDLHLARIITFALEHPWAVTEDWLATIAVILGRRAAGHYWTQEEIAAAVPAKRAAPAGANNIAVIPIYGVIVPRANTLTDVSGGTSFETLGTQVRSAIADATISTILFDVDSPGGNAAGAPEFAKIVRAASAKKRVVAHANHLMASAAYWTMAGATEIVASPSAEVGSIGVLTIHKDLSKAFAEQGIAPTLISAGKFKGEGNPFGPLTDDARAFIKGRVDQIYSTFVRDVAKGRKVPVDDVRSGYGQGRTVSAADALSLGMVDRIEDFPDTLSGLLTPSSRDSVAALAPTAATDQGQSTDDGLLASQEPVDVRFANDIEHRLLDMRLRDLAR